LAKSTCKEAAQLAQEQIHSQANLAAQSQEHVQSANLLKLLTDSEIAIPTGLEQSSGSALAVDVGGGTGSPLGVTSASGSPIGFGTPSGTPGSAPILTGTFTPTAVLPSGFSPVPVTPGYQPLPVIGSREPADAAAIFSSAEMMSMIAGSLR